MTPHPSVASIHAVFGAFGGGDRRVLADVIADDAVWHVGGSASVARTYRGRHEIFELFRLTRKLTGGTYRTVLKWALADDEHAVAVYRATGTRLGRTLDIDQALLIDLRARRWHKIVAVPTEPAAFDAFWA